MSQWDFDGNGTVDKIEFRKAMKALGLNAPVTHVDGLFHEFDADGGGERRSWRVRVLLQRSGILMRPAPLKSLPLLF